MPELAIIQRVMVTYGFELYRKLREDTAIRVENTLTNIWSKVSYPPCRSRWPLQLQACSVALIRYRGTRVRPLAGNHFLFLHTPPPKELSPDPEMMGLMWKKKHFADSECKAMLQIPRCEAIAIVSGWAFHWAILSEYIFTVAVKRYKDAILVLLDQSLVLGRACNMHFCRHCLRFWSMDLVQGPGAKYHCGYQKILS